MSDSRFLWSRRNVLPPLLLAAATWLLALWKAMQIRSTYCAKLNGRHRAGIALRLRTNENCPCIQEGGTVVSARGRDKSPATRHHCEVFPKLHKTEQDVVEAALRLSTPQSRPVRRPTSLWSWGMWTSNFAEVLPSLRLTGSRLQRRIFRKASVALRRRQEGTLVLLSYCSSNCEPNHASLICIEIPRYIR